MGPGCVPSGNGAVSGLSHEEHFRRANNQPHLGQDILQRLPRDVQEQQLVILQARQQKWIRYDVTWCDAGWI